MSAQAETKAILAELKSILQDALTILNNQKEPKKT
jgi:hypothetical protein